MSPAAKAEPIFQVDEKSSLPIWLQLKNRFIFLITSGQYRPGDQLPSVRALAVDAGVNYNTVSKVYMSLEQDGYVESRQRQGAFVRDVSGLAGVSPEVSADLVTHEYLQRCLELGMSLEDIEERFAQALDELRAKTR